MHIPMVRIWGTGLVYIPKFTSWRWHRLGKPRDLLCLELVNKLGKIMKFFMGKYYYHYELPFSKLI